MLEYKDLLSIQEVRTKVEKAYAAWLKYRNYSQEQIDAIVERMAAAARANAKRLADLAVEETGYGNAKDKYVKNLLCSDWLPRRMRGMKTVGIIRELPEEKLVEIGVPVGVVAAILPTTNPTSTAIYKTLISLKAGNAIVISPHPRAHRCTCTTAAILYQAAIEAGAPEDIIQCVDNATMEATNALMRHERTGVILSTGGHGIVKAAYSSGKPAFGVGPGNVPVLVDTSADLDDAIPKIVAGKSFDYGTVCSSEQAIVAEASMRDRIMALLKAQKAYLATDAQKDALGKLLIMPNWTVNPQCVGQAPTKIAKMAGFEVPADTSIICAEVGGVGKQHPLSAEKLSPVLSLYFVPDFNAAMDTCFALLKFGGAGHTAAIYSKNDARTREYALRMPANRILVNTPAPQGSTGIPLHDPRLWSGGGEHHVGQCRPAALDQHQTPGIRGSQAGRGIRDAAGLQRGSVQPCIWTGRSGRPRHGRGGSGALPCVARHRGGHARLRSLLWLRHPQAGRQAIRSPERGGRRRGPLSGTPWRLGPA
jgi:acetaldehyde dehydrogenase (acetylating)